MVQLMHSFVGHQAPEDVLELVRRGDVGSFCLFAFSNVESPAQLRHLTDSLREAARQGGHPQPIIGIDQEGGQLIAVTGGATELPGNMALGATRDPELAREAGRVLARELLAMGINMNFAPVMDVNVNPRNPVVGVRSFGEDPQLVSEMGVAMIQGMEAEGVIATAKHFPGHGDTMIDTHHGSPAILHDLERLNEVELRPFRTAVSAGVGAVMTAHILFPALDKQHPATISSNILHGVLRDQMDFNGLIVSDAMDMYAIAQMGAEPSIEAALQAGVDLVLLGHLPDQIKLNATFQSRFNPEAITRINETRRRLPQALPDLEIIGCTEHQDVARRIAEKSITLVRDRGQRLPLRLDEKQTIGIIHVQPVDLTPADTSSHVTIQLPQAIQKRHANIVVHTIPYQGTADDVRAALKAVEHVDVVLVGTIQADNDPIQADLVRALRQRGQEPIVAALRLPYDIMAFPEIDTYLCTYGIRPVTIEALAAVLFGEIRAEGILPCQIPGITQYAASE